MFQVGLNFEILGKFEDHEGFDGIILGHKNYPYHLEFTQHKAGIFNELISKDNLIIFYIPEKSEFDILCSNLLMAGFNQVISFNPYWNKFGKAYEDLEGYRIVIQNGSWDI